MARTERKIKPRQELSDLVHGNGKAAYHALGSLLPPTMYAFGLKVLNSEDAVISAGEAMGIGLAGSFALRYMESAVDFLIPVMQRESYIRRNQRNVVKIAAGLVTAYTTGMAFASMADAPLIYTALTAAFSVTSFAAGRASARKMPEMKYTTTVPATALLLGSSLYLGGSGLTNPVVDIKEKTTGNENSEERAVQEPTIEYTAKPPFTVWPAQYDLKLVNSCFGFREKRSKKSKVSENHRGIDIQAPWHTSIVSVGNGVVAKVYLKEGSVQIDHGEGIFTEYGHLDRVYVKEGDLLLAGERIGLSGGSSDGKNGPSTGPHLHFMVDDNGVSQYLQDASGNAAVLKGKVNPLCYMNEEEIGFRTQKKSACNTQGGKNKYCVLYKSPLEIVVDIETKYGEIVQRYVDPMKFDPGLMYALIAQESQGEANTTSATGAAGLMQFIKDTGFRYGLCDNKICAGRDDRYDPEKSIAAGVAYYGRLQKKFQNYDEKDIFAIAAYNAGDHLITKAIEKTEWSDPTWEQVAILITPELVMENSHLSRVEAKKRAAEVKEHVVNVSGYYSFYKSATLAIGETEPQP